MVSTNSVIIEVNVETLKSVTVLRSIQVNAMGIDHRVFGIRVSDSSQLLLDCRQTDKASIHIRR